MFQKRIIKFLKLSKLQRKQQPKHDLLRSLSIFAHRTSLLHRINQLSSIILFKNKNRVYFQFPFFFWCFGFHFRHACLNNLPFLCYKEQQEQCRCTTEGEKSKKCYARNHNMLFVPLRGTAQEYLFHSYQSLHSLRKFTQRRTNFRE